MYGILTNVATASAAEAEKSFFEALWIDWTLLVIQTVAFLILLWFLGKFVYPPLTRMLEKREEDIEAGVKAAQDAEKKADVAREETAKLLKQARKDAADIVSTAKEEAAAVVSAAESKSKDRAERLIEQIPDAGVRELRLFDQADRIRERGDEKAGATEPRAWRCAAASAPCPRSSTPSTPRSRRA